MTSSDSRIVVEDIGTDWIVEMEWPEGETQGGPGILIVRARNPDAYPVGGISSTLLRQIDFRDAADRMRRQLAVSERRSKSSQRYESDRMDRLRAALAEGLTDEYFALLSSAYLALVNRGQDKPVHLLAGELGKSLPTVKGHLWQARKRELLTGTAGRKGGQLTPKATEILEQVVPAAPKSPRQHM